MRKTGIKEEITPAHLRCIPASCPAVYTLSNGDLLIIGKKLSEDLSLEIQGKVAPDEFAVRISPDCFRHVKRRKSLSEILEQGLKDAAIIYGVLASLMTIWAVLNGCG